MAEIDSGSPFTLGIDLGAHSLGWAMVALDANEQPCGLIATGVRTFEAGVEASYDQMLEGKQKSRAANRREKRGPRRQFWRRAWRRYKVLKSLVSHGLLRDPKGPSPDEYDLRKPADQDRFLKCVDEVLRKRLRPAEDDSRRHLWEQVWPYELRASALERKLDPLELGRALYHLAQRRGFLSNRKTDSEEAEDKPKKPKKGKKSKPEESTPSVDVDNVPVSDGAKEDPKQVRAAIEKLTHDIEQAIADYRFRTLGFYFARHVNPEEHRIRKRWTSRAMYEAEFDAIWDAQRMHHPQLLTEDFKRTLSSRDEVSSIFFQRPLKSSSHLVGHCDLEPSRRRALQAIPLAQRFRLLQTVNDLTVLEPEGREYRQLSDEERAIIIDALSTRGDLAFKEIRKLLKTVGFIEPKIDKETGEVLRAGHTFSHERPPIDKLPGDRTTQKILACDEKAAGIAQRWRDMSDGQQERLVLAILEFTDGDSLRDHIVKRFGFTTDQASELKRVRLEQARCSLSKRAMARLLPFMESRTPFATAKEEVPEYRAKAIRQSTALDCLPRVLATDCRQLPSGNGQNPSFKEHRDLRNPAVTRGLAELRKVVNAIIRRYGKPAYIHVELGRELKKSPKDRARIAKDIEDHRDSRVRAVEAMQKEIGLTSPSESDKERWLLGLEQAWHCPYCGQSINRKLLVSGSLQVDHIIPREISLDNNFPNKVLCHAECN